MFTNNSHRYVFVIFGLTLFSMADAATKRNKRRNSTGSFNSTNTIMRRLEEETSVGQGMDMPSTRGKSWKAALRGERKVVPGQRSKFDELRRQEIKEEFYYNLDENAPRAWHKARFIGKPLGEYIWWSSKRRNGLTKMGKGLAIGGAAVLGALFTAGSFGTLYSGKKNLKNLGKIAGEKELIKYTFVHHEKRVFVRLQIMEFYECKKTGMVKLMPKKNKSPKYAKLKEIKDVNAVPNKRSPTDSVRFKFSILKGSKSFSPSSWSVCDRNIYFNKPVLCDGKEFDYRFEVHKQYMMKPEYISLMNQVEGEQVDLKIEGKNQFEKFRDQLKDFEMLQKIVKSGMLKTVETLKFNTLATWDEQRTEQDIWEKILDWRQEAKKRNYEKTMKFELKE